MSAADINQKPRHITYRRAEDFPHIYVLNGFLTGLTLDDGEVIGRAELGTDYFMVGFLGRESTLKPIGTEAGHKTNLRLVCLSGNAYMFIVEEVSHKPEHADLEVTITNGDVEAQKAAQAPQELFTKDQVSSMQQQLAAKEAEIQHEHEQSQQRVAKAEQTEANAMKCDYEFYDRKGRDFKPSGCEDGRFSFFTVDTPEKPTLVEFKDGKDDKPALVQATFANGKYTVPKVLDAGELIVGKSHVKFRRIT